MEAQSILSTLSVDLANLQNILEKKIGLTKEIEKLVRMLELVLEQIRRDE